MIKYTVLISVYKKENPDYFQQALQSMVSQTVQPEEIVVVCDGPVGEKLDQVLEEYQGKYPAMMKVVRLAQNQGLGNALNEGLKHCTTELVARMDSDDISALQRCEKQLEIFETEQVDIVGTAVHEFSGNIANILSDRVLPEKPEDILQFSKKRNPFNHPSVMFRKEAVVKAGGYQHFPFFEDYYLWVRMLQQGCRGYNLQKPLLYMRAGDDFFMRRGGMAYVKDIAHFKKTIYRMGYTTFTQYMTSLVPHVVIGLMPNAVRKLFYKKVLRKKAE